MHPPTISVVTPTLDRPEEVRTLLSNLAEQYLPPHEVILVNAAHEGDERTARVVEALRGEVPYQIVHIRRGGGTAIQRNIGIDAATGAFIAFIDDDMMLDPDFFEVIMEEFKRDEERKVAAIAGYITNQHLDPTISPRWRWYRRLRLFSTYEPGLYDYATGYPINRYLQPPHDGVRSIDFMGANCAVWRREPFDQGLRFSPFFIDYGVVEDAHLALSARRQGWIILELGRARCQHLHSPRGRIDHRRVMRKTAINYRFLFVDIVPDRSLKQEFNFWKVQIVDLFRTAIYALRKPQSGNWSAVVGKAEGIWMATKVRPGDTRPPSH